MTQKIVIWAPSHNFVGLYLCNWGMYRQSEKKLVKQQYLLHVYPQYGELRPTSGWDWLAGLGHPSYFQRLPRLGSVTARQSSSERQPNFAALNRGRHLCSAGRPSGWALAHILVDYTSYQTTRKRLHGWLVDWSLTSLFSTNTAIQRRERDYILIDLFKQVRYNIHGMCHHHHHYHHRRRLFAEINKCEKNSNSGRPMWARQKGKKYSNKFPIKLRSVRIIWAFLLECN